MTRRSLIDLYAEHAGMVSHKWFSYLNEYDRLLGEYRDKPIRLLEIGVQNGGSLEIWAKYFANASALIGCDINPDCAGLRFEDSRIAVVIGDSNDVAVTSEVLRRSPQFDIIIDDGSHLSGDIVKSFALYFPHLAPGGVFVAEDLHCSYWMQFEGGLFDPYSSIAFLKRLVDILNHEHWGVNKTREDLLNGFFRKYGFELDSEVLSQVHSVEFVNSIGVIRKKAAAENGLGHHYVAGTLESVVTGHQPLHGQAYSSSYPTDQSLNPWTARSEPPEQVIEQTELQLQAANRQLEFMTRTLSWRITSPLRFLADQFKRIYRLSILINVALKQRARIQKSTKK